MTREEIDELAALYAAGALEGPELRVFKGLLRDPDCPARQILAQLQETIALAAAATVGPQTPESWVKEAVIARARAAQPHRTPVGAAEAGRMSDALQAGFRFIAGSDSSGWLPMLVPGAWIKVLSHNAAAGYAVVLGRLDAGTRYPPHRHLGAEDIYMLAGDLHLGDHVLGPGDFHHADPGTEHGENFSVEGCTLLAVINSPDVLAQMGLQ